MIIAEAKIEDPSWSYEELTGWLQVSASGYDAWRKRTTKKECSQDTDVIKLIFEKSKAKFGARRIKMKLEREFGVVMNLKKIRRIMKVNGLICRLRRKSAPRASFYANEEHATAPNLLDRNFDVDIPETVFCTDITYLDYGKGHRAYLSIVQDVATNEIVHYKLGNNMSLGLAVDGIRDLYFKIKSKGREAIMVHSDQGSHYTSPTYRRILDELGILQSMSRRGCSPDNGLVESTFGHIKDEMEYKSCENYDELEKVVNKYIKYYNFERPQWGLKAKTPAECRGFEL